jgi:hypothetical protein
MCGFRGAGQPYWLAGGALWISELHRRDVTHLTYGSALLIILVEYVIWNSLVDGVNFKRWFPNYIQPSESDLIVEPYLNKNFEIVAYSGIFRMLKTKKTSV